MPDAQWGEWQGRSAFQKQYGILNSRY